MDNYDRMKTKLRKLLFGDRLTYSERVVTLKKKEEQEELKKELSKVEIDSEIENIVV